MTRIRTLTTAMAILAFGAMTAGCAGNPRYSFGPNQPMMQSAVPAEEPDDVADVPWDRCDGECRFAEVNRICTVSMPTVNVSQRRLLEGRLMQHRTRQSFHAEIRQDCVRYGGRVQYASGYGRPQYPADRVLDSLGPNGQVKNKIRSVNELSEAERECGFMATVRGKHGFAVSQRCLAKQR